MKNKLKILIKKNKRLNHLIYEVGLVTKVPISRVFWNYVINFILRQNTSCKYPVNYKSTILCGEKLILEGNKSGTVASLIVSSGCYLQAGNGIRIGEGTIWAPNVVIVSANHDMSKSDKSWAPGAEVQIGKNCWLGANCVILPGVKLGDNTVVGAGAVVTKSFVEGNVVIAGNPANKIK